MYTSRNSSSQAKSPLKKCLDMIIKVEDMVSTFQVQPTSKPCKSLEKQIKKEESYEIIPPLKHAVEVLKSRLAGYTPTTVNLPNFRRFKQALPTDCLIGPGFYHFKNKSVNHHPDFEETPRLQEKFVHKLRTAKARRNSLTIEDVSKLTIFDLGGLKTVDHKEKVKKNNEKSLMVQTLGKEIKYYIHEVKKIKLTEKLERIK